MHFGAGNTGGDHPVHKGTLQWFCMHAKPLQPQQGWGSIEKASCTSLAPPESHAWKQCLPHRAKITPDSPFSHVAWAHWATCTKTLHQFSFKMLCKCGSFDLSIYNSCQVCGPLSCLQWVCFKLHIYKRCTGSFFSKLTEEGGMQYPAGGERVLPNPSSLFHPGHHATKSASDLKTC